MELTMNKFTLLILSLTTLAFGVEIPLQKVKQYNFNKSVTLNAQVIQLANAEQSITSQIDGHLEKYFVQPAQKVKKGQKVARIKSITLSKMSASYLSLKKQLKAVEKNYKATQMLYAKGMSSMQDLNNQEIRRDEINAQLRTLESQLQTLGIDLNKLKNATADFILYAHSEGRVSALLKPLHSSISTDEAVISIVKDQAYYIKSFLPLEYAQKVKIGNKIMVKYSGKNILTHVTQVLPKVDEVTQRIVVLSSVDEKVENLFINTYLQSTLYFTQSSTHLAVKKSALSFFNNEWIVFVPKKEEHEEHEKNEDHQEAPYTLAVVEIITQDEEYAAVLGLHEGEEYVSDKSYYVKSMLLKGTLGEHGH